MVLLNQNYGLICRKQKQCQLEPKNGEPERLNQKSEVQFMYDDRALYIGAMFYDSSPDSIFTEFSLRDEEIKT